MRKLVIFFLVFFSASFSLAAVSPAAVSQSAEAVWRGDLTGDGKVDIFDLLALLKVLAGGGLKSEKERQVANTDESRDGSIDIFDLIALLKLLSGQEKPKAIVFSSTIAEIWAVGDGEKVFRDDLDHPSKGANSVWDGSVIRLKGLFNEVLAFQVVVAADSSGVKEVEIAVDPLKNSVSGKVIGKTGGTPYGPGGYIELFSEHYLQVTDPTKPLWFYGSAASAPKRMTGWIPDALIPPDAAQGRGGFPLDIQPKTTQAFWIDLYLPRDTSNYPAGIYQGAVRVFEGGWEVAAIPLEVTILPHSLPEENHSNVWLYHDSVEPYFPELSDREIETMLKYEAHRHRIDLVGGFQPHYSGFEEAMMDSYKPYLDGSAFTEAAGYQGPGQGEGEHLFPIGMYGSAVLGETWSEVQKQADLWVSWFEANAPGVRFFWYLIDEPGEDKFDWIKERADWIHYNPGQGKRLPIFTTREYTSQLDSYIDLWAGYHGVDLVMLPKLKAQGKDHWFYNGARPRYGSDMIEAEAVDFRVNAWVKYIHQVNTWFLWHGTHWRHNSQGPRAGQHQNVFVDPKTYVGSLQEFSNGDGVVFYPGREPFFPDQDRGVNRILPSIRLKNIRRGQQDYEIMWLAEQKAGRGKVLEIVRAVVPKSLEVVMSSTVLWSQRGDDYDAARAKLLELIE
jgi:hypothetical protein